MPDVLVTTPKGRFVGIVRRSDLEKLVADSESHTTPDKRGAGDT